ncbi:flavonol 4'-sulfotransferase-like [Euphorbia lathyris]|uniref:flavonol 4'-sulfotransferase-like n=1 Tax=Euphorbia lathyris TaxID=212925 RepID=UPI0033132EE6
MSANDASDTQNQAEDIEIYISTLPQQPSWRPSPNLYKYQGFWCFSNFLKGIILFQKNFIPQPNDFLLCSTPKSGTTWLKSLSIAISTRSNSPQSDPNLLLTNPPHQITHVPFDSLPKSILNSNTKLIYVCRNPKDVLVSMWHFVSGKNKHIQQLTFQEGYEKFCNGVSAYGPYWDHVLGYWKASLEFPDRVLFLKYEDMMDDTCIYVKKMADFMGCPFSVDEEKQGMVEKIVELCSFESLSNLEVNKSKNISSHMALRIENNEFFRKGKVGDWKNYFTDEMAKKLDQITHHKFSGFGLYV